MNEAREERKKPFREEFAEKIIGLIGRERLRKARETQMGCRQQLRLNARTRLATRMA